MNMFRVGDNVWVESSGQLVFPQPVAITNLVEHDDGTRWAFVEGSSSAVSVDELTPTSRVGANATSIGLAVFSKTGGPLTKRITLIETAELKESVAHALFETAQNNGRPVQIHEIVAMIEQYESAAARAVS